MRGEGRKKKKCLPDNLYVQLCIRLVWGGGGGGRREGRLAVLGRGEEQMYCWGRRRGGGPTAIVHVLPWTKGSSGSVCKPTAGFSPLTRPHAGQNIADRLPQFGPYSLSVSRFEQIFYWSYSEGRIVLVRCVQRAYPFLRTERTHGLSPRICKHQFSDWTSLQVKKRDRFPPINKHL